MIHSVQSGEEELVFTWGEACACVPFFLAFLLLKAVSSFLLPNSQFLLFPPSTQAKKGELKLAPFLCLLTWSNSSSS